jgi:asparagine synthase (glutamine-hydrolysing)
MRDWAEDLLDNHRLNQEGYLNANSIHTKWEQHLNGKANWQEQIWDVLMFQSWLEEQKAA